jgi:PAS domain S-box-containing protein
MKSRLTSMTVGLAIGITVAASIASATGAYLYSLRHSETLLNTARRDALARAELIRGALEHAMLEDDRTLIGAMITTFGREPRVVDVMLLDRAGKVQYSSGPVPAGGLSLDSPTCQACHQFPAAARMSSRVIQTAGGAVLRTVVPIRNREECHGCHAPANPINGVLISDLDTAEIQAATSQDLRWMVMVTGAITLLLVLGIGIVVRLIVVRRLQRFETAARQIAEGDLARRIPISGSDTIAWLAREFNVMADSVNSLVGQVRSERERLETVINSIDDGIVVLDPSRRVVAANDAFIARTGCARDQLLGCSCRREGAGACSVEDCPTVACLQSGQRQIRICERRKRDGTVAWEEVHASPMAGPSGDPVYVVEVWRDISERRVAEARLAESHRLASVGLLASGFSHEMNTPLGTVLACVEGIRRETGGDATAVDWDYIRDNAATARDQVLRCRGITQQFLRMSKGHPSIMQIVNIEQAIAAATRLVAPTARARGVTISADATGSDALRGHADEGELQHALINLLLNAIQACQSGGRVSIRAAAHGRNQVAIAISDDGCGIAPEDQARVFEPFFSVRPGGTGLGLFLSLNFVRHWGGDILLQSAVGRGSTFSIVLPAIGDGVESIPA